jgi:hypothetical protein
MAHLAQVRGSRQSEKGRVKCSLCHAGHAERCHTHGLHIWLFSVLLSTYLATPFSVIWMETHTAHSQPALLPPPQHTRIHSYTPTSTRTACACRYTAFIPLYPVGVAGEMWSVYDALPAIKARGLHSIRLPNPLNFAFDYHTFLVGLLLVYPFLWWQLYSMLLGQRKKRISGQAAAKKKE